jgi:hypothetical protein
MQPDRRRLLARSALAATSLMPLAGCVIAPIDPYYGGEVVTVAPPAPYAEVYGAAPMAGGVWINGYWNWGGGRYAWRPGYWSPPRPGYHYRPHRWVPHRHGYRLDGGRWDRRGG